MALHESSQANFKDGMFTRFKLNSFITQHLTELMCNSSSGVNVFFPYSKNNKLQLSFALFSH